MTSRKNSANNTGPLPWPGQCQQIAPVWLAKTSILHSRIIYGGRDLGGPQATLLLEAGSATRPDPAWSIQGLKTSKDGAQKPPWDPIQITEHHVTSPCSPRRFLWGFAHLAAASRAILISCLNGAAQDWHSLLGAWLFIPQLCLLFGIQELWWEWAWDRRSSSFWMSNSNAQIDLLIIFFFSVNKGFPSSCWAL